MSYINADQLFPPDLMREIQKYVQGSLVYIPKPPQTHMQWGTKSGSRADYDIRNAAIRHKKALGYRIDDLADEYSLSPEGIKKILYGNKKARV